MRISDWSSNVCSSDLHHIVLAKGDFAADRALGSERCDVVDRKIALRQRLQHLAPDGARRSNHCYLVSHCLLPIAFLICCSRRGSDERPPPSGQSAPPQPPGTTVENGRSSGWERVCR